MRLQTSTIPVHVQLPPPKSISFLPSGQTSLAETILRSTPWLVLSQKFHRATHTKYSDLCMQIKEKT